MKSLDLYTVRVGTNGSFYVAADSEDAAREVGEQWASEHEAKGDVTVTHHKSYHSVYVAGKR